ncbi:MAG TPA: YbaB/EbfC family nucleoid-associated protein [Nitrospiria bacterium]|nr:YbaB/EbfC family nucleoid-associated protein [Nitrospiria bacterium]
MFNPKLLADMMKQAQSLQERLDQAREALGRRTVEASAGGGMVSVVVNGHQEVVSIRIDPAILAGADPTVLQELIRSAVNEGLRQARAMAADAMKEVAGGLPLPPGLTPWA